MRRIERNQRAQRMFWRVIMSHSLNMGCMAVRYFVARAAEPTLTKAGGLA